MTRKECLGNFFLESCKQSWLNASSFQWVFSAALVFVLEYCPKFSFMPTVGFLFTYGWTFAHLVSRFHPPVLENKIVCGCPNSHLLFQWRLLDLSSAVSGSNAYCFTEYSCFRQSVLLQFDFWWVFHETIVIIMVVNDRWSLNGRRRRRRT